MKIKDVSFWLSKSKQAWDNFVVQCNPDTMSVRPSIAESWKRCKEHKLDPNMSISSLTISKAELDIRLATHSDFVSAAKSYMQMVVDTCEEEIVVHLCDADGCLLVSCGQIPTTHWKISHIQRGTMLNEESAGTTAVGLVIRDKRPSQVVAEEHFCRFFHPSASSCAPIFDAAGKFCGAVAVVVDKLDFYPNLLGMAVSVANAIEQHLKLIQARASLTHADATLNKSNKSSTLQNGRARYVFDDMIGKSESFIKLKEIAKKAAASTSNVLLLGESGTGKELLAQSIHNASIRGSNRFVAINCGAMPKDMIESELFGYVDGAFTGSRRGGAEGKFEYASGGSIFLDEIGDMPLDLQVVLLRVIQEQQITRVGGNKITPIDVRIIAATHHNLREDVLNKSFREDLYYRLNVFPIYLPPLRNRIEDVPHLSEYFLRTLSSKIGKPYMSLTPDAINKLMDYHWPGNIRELENVLERAINVVSGHYIDAPDLFIEGFSFSTNKSVLEEKPSTEREPNSIIPLDVLEKDAISHALSVNKGNVKQTAIDLGISRNTLYSKIKTYGLAE